MYRKSSQLGIAPNDDAAWPGWVKTGIDVITGKATIAEPKVVVTTGDETTLKTVAQNPIIWIALASLAVALLKK